MSGLAFTEIDDAVLITQENLVKRGAFTDLQTDLQDHVAVREMWKNRVKKFAGGDYWDFFAQVDHNHSARFVGLYETDGSSLTDTMRRGRVEVRFANAHYIYDQRDPLFQRGGHSIVDLIQTRYVAMMVSWFEKLEAALWSKPATSADTKTPFGVTYWILKDTAGAFTAQNPSGFSAGRAGIDSTGTGNARWANWGDDYEEVEKEDLIRKMRKAHRQIKFRSPVAHATPDLGNMRNGIYVGDTVIGLMEELLEQQNMNLGNDLASKDGRTMFKSTPITYAPYLDNDSENPVYMIDWKVMAIGVMDGWENRLGAPYMVPDKHTVRRVDLDAGLQMICTDLRKQAVLHNPA